MRRKIKPIIQGEIAVKCCSTKTHTSQRSWMGSIGGFFGSAHWATFHHLPAVLVNQGGPSWLMLGRCDAHLQEGLWGGWGHPQSWQPGLGVRGRLRNRGCRQVTHTGNTLILPSEQVCPSIFPLFSVVLDSYWSPSNWHTIFWLNIEIIWLNFWAFLSL